MNHNLIKRIFLIIPVLFALAASVAEAAIPDAERQVLIDIYNGTGGGTWTTNTNWNSGGGTECTWYRGHLRRRPDHGHSHRSERQ